VSSRSRSVAPSDVAPAAVRLAELGRNLGAATVMYHAQVAARLGLSVTEHKCLDLAMQQEQPITAGQLAELSKLSTGAITGVVDRLERAGYVRRVRDPRDRRKVLIEVSPGEWRHFTTASEGLLRAIAGIVADHTAEELAAVEAFLEHVTGAMWREADRLQSGADRQPG
jgi:DNA-binding MarR family transcriptional regulator